MNPAAALKQHWIACTAALLGVITFLSLWPLPELPELPGNDKTGHLIAYATLMLPASIRRPKYWILYGFLFVAYSGVIELIQPFVNRYAEWLDLAANSAGIFLGAVIGRSIDLFVQHIKTQKTGTAGVAPRPRQ
jgi:VanZ family protein